MSSKMSAIVMDGVGKVRVVKLPIPTPKPGNILLRVWSPGQKSGATSECGSNHKRWMLKDSRSGARQVAWGSTDPLGHEFSGYVEAVGAGVSGLDPDQLYAVAPLVPCYNCTRCNRGYYQHCKTYGFIGSSLPGAYAEFVEVPARNLVPMAPGVTAETASLIEPLACAVHGLIEIGALNPDGTLARRIETAAVVGMGYIGANAVAVFRHLGVKNIVAAHRSKPRLELASSLGATHTVDTTEGTIAKVCQDLDGADVVFEAAGNPEVVEQCIQATGPKCGIIWLGTAVDTMPLTVPLQQRLMRSEARQVHPFMSHGDPFPGPAWTVAAKLLAEGCIDPGKLIDGRCKTFEELAAALNGNISGQKKCLKITLS